MDSSNISKEGKNQAPSAACNESETVGNVKQRGIIMRKEVESDNSCLFSSISFLLTGGKDVSSPSELMIMRELIVQTIESESGEYTEAILGKPVEEYCKWILKPNSWGGGIELAILAGHYGMEIAVANSITGIISIFGEDRHYSIRMYLIFDGIHYDPLYMDLMQPDGKIQTMFPCDDNEVLNDVIQLVNEAKASKNFTDTNKFTLKCEDCSVLLVGQLDARDHAIATQHTNFSEVDIK